MPGWPGCRSCWASYKDRDEDRLAGLDAGADRYLTKSSFTDDSLITAVADLLMRSGAVR